MKLCVSMGVSLLALLVSGTAFAQDASSSAPQDAGQSADEGVIVVTATLRNENLQDVPIAVTAFNTQTLDKAGVRDIRALDNVSASFNLNSTQTESGGTTLRVRGVGTTGNNTGLESAVGIFLDGVYLSRPGVALGDLLDVSQVELLRGPQGTLFGRNTSAGALNIKTLKPNLTKFEGFANATYGNYNLINVQGGVSAPIVEGTLAARLSGAYRKMDGTVTSTTGATSNNRDRFIVRGQLLFEPNPDLSIRLIGDYQKSDERCCDAPVIQESSLVALGAFAAVGLPLNGGVPVSGTGVLQARIANGEQFFDEIEQWGVSAEINLALGNADLVSITGYRDSSASSTQNADFNNLRVYSASTRGATAVAGTRDNFTGIKTFTQEIRLSGTTLNDKLEYLVGGYYSDEQINELQNVTLGRNFQQYISAAFFPFFGTALGPNPARDLYARGVSAEGSFANNVFTQSARNFSVFTNNTFRFTDTFGFNFGLRYSDDRKRGAFTQPSASSPACGAVLGNVATLNANAAAAAAFAAANPGNAAALAQAQGAGGIAALAPLAVGLTCFPFAVQANFPGAGTVGGPPTPALFDRVFKDNELIYTAKLVYEPVENVNTYLSYSHGYKSGGFNLDPTGASGGGDPRFNSEKIDAYEFGIKTKLLNNALTANFSVFHQVLSDFQVLEFTGVQFVTFNVSKAKATGAEVELNARLSREFSVNGAFTYTDARYPDDCAPGVTNVQVTSLCGQQLTNAPDMVVIAGFAYEREISPDLSLGLSGSIRAESDRRTSTQAVRVGTNIPNPFDIQQANAKVNLRAGIGRPDGLWRIEVWGNNITNITTRNVTFDLPLRGGDYQQGTVADPNRTGASVARGVFVQDPRMYGVTLRTRF